MSAPEIVQWSVAQMESSENPKAVAARTRFPQLSVVPPTSLAWLAEAHLDGAKKYGALNWREKPRSMSSPIDAAVRHLLALKEGEDVAGGSQLPHAAHVMAGMSVLLDAQAYGTLIDDRVLPRTDAWENHRQLEDGLELASEPRPVRPAGRRRGAPRVGYEHEIVHRLLVIR